MASSSRHADAPSRAQALSAHWRAEASTPSAPLRGLTRLWRTQIARVAPVTYGAGDPSPLARARTVHGLITTAFTRARSARSSSVAESPFVTRSTGMWAVVRFHRRLWQSATPSMYGSCSSVMTSAGGFINALRSASRPSSASATSTPLPSTARQSARVRGSRSATSTRAGWPVDTGLMGRTFMMTNRYANPFLVREQDVLRVDGLRVPRLRQLHRVSTQALVAPRGSGWNQSTWSTALRSPMERRPSELLAVRNRDDVRGPVTTKPPMPASSRSARLSRRAFEGTARLPSEFPAARSHRLDIRT